MISVHILKKERSAVIYYWRDFATGSKKKGASGLRTRDIENEVADLFVSFFQAAQELLLLLHSRYYTAIRRRCSFFYLSLLLY